jgi:hypothetical protein
MAKGGHRYPLVIYTRMMDRWWPAVFALGLALLGLAWAVRSYGYEEWRWLAFNSLGGLNIFLGLLLLVMRKSAYVQPFDNYLRLATPFLRLNISYKRFRRASTSNMGVLFPEQSLSNWRAEIMEPFANSSVIVIELTGYPMPQSTLRMFLSPFFFKDKTPHFVILVDDWMKFSNELESMRQGGVPSTPQQRRDNSILSRLPTKNK